jgi:hypothetical protein
MSIKQEIISMVAAIAMQQAENLKYRWKKQYANLKI